jgi:hypothetical protein
MQINEAQREMRTVYWSGSLGPFVSGAIWLVSAALGTWSSRNNAVLALVVGGMFIFPIGLVLLRALGQRASVRRENPLSALAMQSAFTVPLAIPLIIAAARWRPEWFYAGFLIVVGAHYLMFVTLYGQRAYYVIAAAMVGAGFALPFLLPGSFAAGGWIGGAQLVLFGAWLSVLHAREARLAASPAHSP